MMIRIREAAVAGSFYPADPGELQLTVGRLLDAVVRKPAPTKRPPKAVIVPHAGYVYSGPVAATAYAQLRPFHSRYRRVVLLGPSHYAAFGGLAVSSASAFRTPLGDVPLDRAVIDGLQHPAVSVIDAAHRPEHSLEVQLPFLQSVLASFTLVPLLVGDADPMVVSAVIERLWDGRETLAVVSSDLSHYLGYGEARKLDQDTCHAIERLEGGTIRHAQACGATSLRGLLLFARRRGLHVETLDVRNSGDTSGSRGRVVGYGAWLFLEDLPCERAA